MDALWLKVNGIILENVQKSGHLVYIKHISIMYAGYNITINYSFMANL